MRRIPASWKSPRADLGLPLIIILLLGCTGCAARRLATPDDFQKLRDYTWTIDTLMPQPEWHPQDRVLICRTNGALLLLVETAGRPEPPIKLPIQGLEDPWDPIWIAPHQVAFGPKPEIRRDKEGRVLIPMQGVCRFTLHATLPSPVEMVVHSAYRPVFGTAGLLAERGNRILRLEGEDNTTPIEDGFRPVPRRDGLGLAFQETPLFQEDLWTGDSGLGRLVVRWTPRAATTVPAGLEPRWTAKGGLVATQLTAAVQVPLTGTWWKAGSRLVHLPGSNEPIREIASGLHSPDPHPTQDILAAVDAQERVVLLDYAGSNIRVVADRGARPRWSADGLRLLIEEPGDKPGQCRLRVILFQIGNGA